MKSLHQAVTGYLQLHRALGFKLDRNETRLRQFLRFMKGKQASRITTALALEFATQVPNLDPQTKAHRLAVVRALARYCLTTDPATEIPPPGLLPVGVRRKAPYLYSEAEVRRLLKGAMNYRMWQRFPGPWWGHFQAWTFYCIFGLLAVTGMRLGEVLDLQPQDIDWTGRVLTIRKAKFGKSRLVPLHPSTLKALATFLKHRDRFFARRQPRCELARFFVTSCGTRLRVTHVNRVFLRISRQIGLRAPQARRGPRLHDLRHRFALETLRRWYLSGQDVERLLPVLSTYLGHTHMTGTYWYLTCTPALMDAAGARLEHRWKGLR